MKLIRIKQLQFSQDCFKVSISPVERCYFHFFAWFMNADGIGTQCYDIHIFDVLYDSTNICSNMCGNGFHIITCRFFVYFFP